MITLTISAVLLFASPATERQREHAQTRRHALQLTDYLRKTDPRILKEVMQQMGWVTSKQCRARHTRNRRNEQDFRDNEKRNRHKRRLNEINQWEIDMLLDMAGIPRQRIPKKKIQRPKREADDRRNRHDRRNRNRNNRHKDRRYR